MAAFHYEYRVKRLYKAPAQAVGELCEALQESDKGLTPATLLDASRAEGSLLHDDFEWVDSVAAEKYRLSQAQDIIQNVIIVQESSDEEEREEADKPSPVRGFVNIPGGKTAYVTLQNAMSNSEWRNHLLRQAKGDMEAFIGKYRRLEELASVIQAMDEAKQAIVG